MAAISGVILGIVTQILALGVYNATPAEGFIAYLLGFIFGVLLVKEVREKRDMQLSV
ncbi:hypothetical protein NYE48_27955 [Paenibacillus sp. FSL M7-1455]|uniref:hypothetical protein n=1 Tax=Paenibacillus sp. FSL M7-1455 TaxID=2975316 RepID=UPI0030F80FA9